MEEGTKITFEFRREMGFYKTCKTTGVCTIFTKLVDTPVTGYVYFIDNLKVVLHKLEWVPLGKENHNMWVVSSFKARVCMSLRGCETREEALEHAEETLKWHADAKDMTFDEIIDFSCKVSEERDFKNITDFEEYTYSGPKE